MVKKITAIMLALMTGLVSPVSTIAEEKMQPQPASAPEQTEAPTDLGGGISNGYPTPAPEEDATATDKPTDESPDANDENTDENAEENEDHPNIEGSENRVKAFFASGVEQNEDGTYVWNVNPDEEEHTFAYRLELNELDQTQVKVLAPSTVFRDGEEGDFIASDLESESSKLHLKVYEIATDEEGNETKLEVKNEPRKEEQTDGISAIAEANKEVQGTPLPDTSVSEEEQKYSEHYKSQLSEESGVLEISSINEAVLNNSVLQIEYTVENEIYGNVTPQVFTAVLNILDNGKTAIEQCESNELEFVKKGGRKELKKDNVETVDKDDNASPLANTPAYAILYGNGELVFQRGSTPDASKGKAVKTYTGFETETYTYKTVPWYGNRASIKAVSFKDVIKPISTAYWFGSCSKVTAIDCTNLDTSAVTNMFAMFSGCTALTSLDLSSFNTSAVTSMYSMFNNCSSLTSLNVSSFDTSAVTDMIQMFNDCKALTSLDLSSFNTSAVKYMDSMFRNCSSLTSLDLSSFNTSAVTNMNGMFYECRSLISLNVSSFNTSAVTRMDYMFRNCSSLTNLDVSSFNTSAVTRMDGMFYLCTALETLTLGTKFSFKGDTKLVDTTWRGINTGKEYTTSVLTSTYDGSTMADTYAKPKPAYAILYESGELVFQRGRTPDASKGKALKTYTGFETKTYTFINRPPWYENRASIKVVSFKDAIKPVSTAYWFDPCPKVTAIDCTNLDTSTVTNMGSMFAGCTALETLTLGTKFAFKGDTKLVDATWHGIKTNKEYTTSVLTSTYNGSTMADTYRKYIDIKFDALGGKSSESTKPGYIGMAFNSLPTAEKGGYDFVGWFTEKQGGTQLLVNRPITQSTYYAHWKVSQYTIAYSLNGGSISGQKTTYNVETANFTLPIPTKTGYTFTGWTGTGLSSPTKSVTISQGSIGNRSYTANWQPNQYTVTYNGNGATSGTMSTDTVTYGTDYTARANGFTKTGYTFAGWNEKADGTGTSWTNWIGKPWNWSYTKNITLYAQWTSNTYTYNIKYVSKSGASLGTSTVSGTFGSSKNVTAPAKTGYSTPVAQNVAFDSTTPKTITFTYTPIDYTITYNLNGGSISGQKTSYNVETADFTLPTPTRTGYTFTGWTGSNGSTPQTTVKITKGSTGNKSYNANWKANNYYVTIHPNNGTLKVSDTSIKTNADGSAVFIVTYGSTNYYALGVSASRSGYTTTGLYTAMSGGTKLWNNGGACSKDGKYWDSSNRWIYTGNVDVYPQWTPNTYTYNIKYVSKTGVALGTATVSGTFGSSKNATAPAKTGYSTPGAQKVTFDSENAKTITFTYTPINYTITYDVNGGNSLSGERTTYNVESSAYTLPTPSRAGHTFTGWTGSNGTTAQTSVVLAKGTTGNKSYTANWKANTYTVTYNGNGATSGTMPTDTVTYGTNYTTRANGFTRPGYTFVGWTENADGTGSSWTSWIGKPWNWTYTKSITLYAQWTKDTYSISYNLNGGSVSENPTSYQVDTADITLKNPSKTGYKFTGWTGSNGSTAQTTVKIAKGSTGNKSYTANWTANTYTYNIKYVSKSGVALGTTTVSGAYDSSKNVTAPVKAGYSTPVAQKVTFDSVNAKTITFTYTPVDYAITYDLVGGSISGQKTSYNIETANFALPTPVRKGYTFAGWTGTGLSSATKSVTVAKGSTGARSYTATWAPTNYTITYNLDGGSVSGQKTSYNIETADFTLPAPSKTGHTFLGWTGTGLSSATKTVTVAKGSTGNRSYTANWSINQYDIILKGDGGTESVTYGGKTYPLDATHSVTIRANYNTNTAVTYKVKPKYHIVSETGTSMSNTDFSWSNNIGKEGSTGGQTWTTCAFTRTITIKTASNQFTVAFNANTGTGTMNNQAVTNNANQKVNANAFKKTGYTFKNWNTNTDGTGATYANSATVDSIVASNGATVTLYAQWTKDTYTISYNLNGGSVTGNPTSYQVDTADITLKNPSKTGYSFAGWTGSNGTTAQTTVKIAKGSTGNKSYTANWAANTYTYNIKYVSKSGVALGTATVSGTFETSKNVTAPAKTGYTVPSAQKVTFDSVSAKTITFTYTPVDYTITYDVNGGNSLSGERTTYNVESSAYTLPMPSRAGHTFTGWTGSNGTTAQTSVVLAKGTTGNKSYTANWKANTYTVTYNGNGATSGTMPTDTVTYGTNYTTRANGFTRPGYKFAGWTENADGTGGNWTNWIGKPWTWTYTRSITLYAQWKPNKLTINYHNDGAQTWTQYPGDAVINVADKDIVKTETVNYDSVYDHADSGLLDSQRFTKTGYHTGDAWKVGSKTSTTKVSDGDNTLETTKGQSVAKYLGQDLSKGNVTVDLYPVFVANTYTIKYDGNGASGGSTASSTHSYDTAKNLTANGFTRTDYAFTGWNTQKNGSGTSYGDKVSVKNLTSTNGGTITLYAQWKSVTATLSKTNWNKIYDKKVTSFEKGTKTVAEAAATAGAIRIDDGTGAPVWAYKEGTKLCYVADVSKIFMPADSSGWFADEIATQEYADTAITSIDLSMMDTSKVVNMSAMFKCAKKLSSINVSEFDTSHVTDMNNMFYSCSNLKSLDVSSFKTNKVENMKSMFNNCSSLKTLDLSNFDTSNVTDTSSMFNNCQYLTLLNISSFSTSNVSTMSNMFYCCTSLTTLDVSNFDTSNVVIMGGMFNTCKSLTSLNVSNFNTSKAIYMADMFYNCVNLTSLDVSNFDTSKVFAINNMFYNCSNLTSLDLSNFDTSKASNTANMFTNDTKLSSLKLGSRFSFKGDAKLPEAATGISKGYTHKWTLNDPYNYAKARTNTELMNSYNGATDAGTWVWEKQPSSLKISNKVDGNMGSKTKSFSTTLSMPTMAGKAVDAVFTDNSGSSTTKTITFNKAGKATFTLTGTSSVTVNKLIPGDKYSVSLSDESKDGYKQISSGATGTIKEDSIAQCSFTNTKGSTLPTGIEAWGTGAVIAIIGALMLVVYFFVHRR